MSWGAEAPRLASWVSLSRAAPLPLLRIRLPTIQGLLLEKDGIKGAAAIPYVSWGMKLWGIGGIVGYIAFAYIADAIGRRPTILLYSVGTLVELLQGVTRNYCLIVKRHCTNLWRIVRIDNASRSP